MGNSTSGFELSASSPIRYRSPYLSVLNEKIRVSSILRLWIEG